MKKIALTILLVATYNVVFSQQKSAKELAQARTVKMLQELNLSEEQVIKVHSINEQFFKEQVSARKYKNREALKGAFYTYKKELKKVLAEEQFKKYVKVIQQQRGNMNGSKKGRRRKKRRF